MAKAKTKSSTAGEKGSDLDDVECICAGAE